MKKKIVFIERKFWGYVSIEKVFDVVAKHLPADKFETSFVKLKFHSNFSGVIKNLLTFRRPEADIYHITGQVHFMALVLPKDRTVLTVHDLVFLRNKSGLRRLALKKLFLDWPVRRLKYVTAISEATKNEIIQQTGCAAEKIKVIENPYQALFLTREARPFRRNRPVVLQIGTLPNKNVTNLIRALEGTICRLRIIGPLDPSIESELRLRRIEYEQAEGLDDDQMKREYENADVVAFCSAYEGFGLPIIEAQAMGVPVVTSDISPLKEVAGAGAFLADPFDHESIREGILKIVEDDEYRRMIIENGFQNIRRFDPQVIAGKYAVLYDEVSG